MIKQLINPGIYPTKINIALLLVRLTGGGFMLTHGAGKFAKLFGEQPIKFADPLGVGELSSLALTVFAEVFCAIFLAVGIGTRFSAFFLLVTMLVAALIFHINDGFVKQELPLMYAIFYLVIVIVGAGKYSIDQLVYDKLK